MKSRYLVFDLDGTGGTSRSAITQANALAARPRRTMLSVTRSADVPHYADRPALDHLVDVRDPKRPACPTTWPTPPQAAALHASESALVPAALGQAVHARCATSRWRRRCPTSTSTCS